MSVIAVAQYTIRDETDMIVSDTAPSNPTVDLLWLDTSGDIDVLKRWDGTDWIETAISQSDIGTMNQSITRNASDITQLSDQIQLKVSTDTYTSGIASKADTSWVLERIESLITQTASDIEFSFTEAKQYTIDVNDSFSDFMNEVRSYQRFSADGIELGMQGSPFMTKLGNTKLSFIQNGVEIAYISNNKLYITEAQVKNRLLIGAEDNGLFEWIVLDTG